MSSYVLGFKDIDKTKIMLVGGKGANLGECTRIEEKHVYVSVGHQQMMTGPMKHLKI